MKILVHTRFYPNIGGIETLAGILAQEWYGCGEKVIIASDVTGTTTDASRFPYMVVYRPNFFQWRKLVRWADVFVHMNVSLRAYWPRWLGQCPFVAAHQSCYGDSGDGQRPRLEQVKLRVAASAQANIAASKAIAESVGIPCTVIPNPFDNAVFTPDGEVEREQDLAFVGRLVSDKGVDILLKAMAILRQRGLIPSLTIIGDGPERIALQEQAQGSGLGEQVKFLGAQSAQNVARALRQHAILVVPSKWNEPFGIVALEGIACGCVVVGSSGGGLPEAIGSCGVTFPNGDAAALAERLAWLLDDPKRQQSLRLGAAAHLEQHHRTTVAKKYLSVFQQAIA